MSQKQMDYHELYQRNQPIISKSLQDKISRFKVTIAGCGSVGGAFGDTCARLGVQRYKLADNGDYELNNLNRQMVDRSAINRNKAEVYSQKIRAINPAAETVVYTQGVTPENIDSLLSDVDFVFDAVDVTTENGMAMKLLLHEKACERKLPVLSAMDLGFTQWLRPFDYRTVRAPLEGNLAEARKHRHPLKALLGPFCPIEHLPGEIAEEVVRLLKDPKASACQLACTVHLLCAMTGPLLLRFIETAKLPPLIRFDLLTLFETPEETQERARKAKAYHLEIHKLLAPLP